MKGNINTLLLGLKELNDKLIELGFKKTKELHYENKSLAVYFRKNKYEWRVKEKDDYSWFDIYAIKYPFNENTWIELKDVISRYPMENEKCDLSYYKSNAEEDYMNTPISVLKYITELETAIQVNDNCIKPEISQQSELFIAFAKFSRVYKSINLTSAFNDWLESQ